MENVFLKDSFAYTFKIEYKEQRTNTPNFVIIYTHESRYYTV